MSKKYLSVEEAAQILGLNTSEVLRAREQDKIRGFADRGTWKFKAEEIDTFRRELDSERTISMDGGSDVLSDDDVLSEQPTVIRKGETSSDSDVRLIYSGAPGSDVPLVESDSDVKLAGAGKSALDTTDSDVKLVQGDKSVSGDRSVSDVRLTPVEDDLLTGSSLLSMSSDSDSDVKLVGRGSDSSSIEIPVQAAAKPTADDTIDFVPDDASVLDDSGISLVGDSGISLERPQDSGISLEKADSGISLSSDSALNLAHDSGISLDITSDSGISLSESLEEPPARPTGKKGKAAHTMPMMDIPLAGELDVTDTNEEIPLLDDDDSKDSSYDLADSHDSTSVITLDDSDSMDVQGDSVEFDMDSASEDAGFDESEDVEVAAEIGEDDELEEMDVFGAADEDFDDDSFQTGESQHEMAVVSRAAPVEQEWGTGVFVSLCFTAVLMLLCGTVAYDLVQGMWQADSENHNVVAGLVLSTLGSLFGG